MTAEPKPIKKTPEQLESEFNLTSDAVKFLLSNVVVTGHLPATAQAQRHLDAFLALEEEVDASNVPPAVPAPKAPDARVPTTITKVPDVPQGPVPAPSTAH